MGRLPSRSGSSFVSNSDAGQDTDLDLACPFGRVESLDHHDLRETAYELFFTSCRSSPGFGGGRNAVTYYQAPSLQDGGNSEGFGGGAATKNGLGLGMVSTGRIKRTLGLKTRKSKTAMAFPSGGPNSPVKVRRPMTSAEVMRQQMRVSEQSDHRLRKTLMRTLVGQMGRRAETIILPLELLRQLKPSEFSDAREYHVWQRRQLRLLEAGLLLHPLIPLDQSNNTSISRLQEIICLSELKPIDFSKNGETMRDLCSSVVSLAWRSPTVGAQADVCHWADGFPLNVHLYLMLLRSIFDIRDETVVSDEVDELMELMKKTWTTLGIDRLIHNVCFTWVLFQQFVATGQVEQDLLRASISMLLEVANDAKRVGRELIYMKILSATLASMQGWAEKRLLDYHDCFENGGVGMMENVLSLALSVANIINEDIVTTVVPDGEIAHQVDASENRVDYYLRSSLRNAFNRIVEDEANVDNMAVEAGEDGSQSLVLLAKQTEELAMREKEHFSPILKRWHPVSAAVAAVTLHNCYGLVLKQYLAGISSLEPAVVQVLQAAGKLEKVLVQMVVEDSVECEDGGKGIVREMIPYEVDSFSSGLMKTWVEERLKHVREFLNGAKETETWKPKSKDEVHAQSAVEFMRLSRDTVDEFFDIPVGIQDELVQDLLDGLESLLQDYTSFVASCGSKQSYIPTLPPLTRCNQDSRFVQLWKKASPCKVGVDSPTHKNRSDDGHDPRPSTSRGTRRMYTRLNTLYYLLSQLHYLGKSLYTLPHGQAPCFPKSRNFTASFHFDVVRPSIQSAIQHVSEVTAYRLIFLDSNQSFYEGLYVGDVADARIQPALRTLKQNLTQLVSVLTVRAQPLAVKEVIKASFEAFLMVLLAGGSDRAFSKSDHEIISEDFRSLKRVFTTCGEGIVSEEVVKREAEVVEGVLTLMGQATEQLVEDFSILACESSGLGKLGGAGQMLPMPPTTGRWNRTDPNTIMRVLCHRNDEASSQFLKRTFQLAKRR